MELLLIHIQRLFPSILRMSLYASWLVLAVLALRLILRKAPKWTHCLLWALVAVRLVCPIVPESEISLVPRMEMDTAEETVITDAMEAYFPEIDFETPRDRTINQAAAALGQNTRISSSASPKEYLPFIWSGGMMTMLLYALLSWQRLRRHVREAIRLRDKLWLCDKIDTPFILGVIRPRIYIPAGLDQGILPQVLAHETAHLRRHDHWWKPLGFLLLSVYWFNPVLWLAYVLLCRDIEFACDEKAVHTLDGEGRRAYAEALFACSVPRFALTVCPLAFGEVDVKTRIRAIAKYEKPVFWVIIAAVAACGAAAVCLLTNPTSLHFDFEREDILGAEVYSAETVEENGILHLDNDTLDALYERLLALRKNHSGNYGEWTPLYTVTVSIRYRGNLQIRGYSDSGEMTELYYDGHTYRVYDPEFQQYIYRLCMSDDLITEDIAIINSAPAPEPVGNDVPWPPALTLLGRDPVTAYVGAFDWMEGNGKSVRDSIHPLLMEPGTELPVLLRALDEDSHSKPNQVFLDFEQAPDTIHIYRWSDTYWETGNVRAEEVPVYPQLTGFDLTPGGYIYEVVADWQASQTGYGTVCYHFYGYFSDMSSPADAIHIPWISIAPLPYRGLSWSSIEPADYGITGAMLDMTAPPDFASLPLEALGAYYLHSDGAGADGAGTELYRRFTEYPDSVLIYLDRIHGQSVNNAAASDTEADHQIALAIAAGAISSDQTEFCVSLLRSCQEVYPVGSLAQSIELLYTQFL